ncbi:Zn-dependent exopeptidase [Sparassis latifolia]
MVFVPAAAPLALLLVTPYDPSLSSSCLARNFYGIHSQQSLFITDDACLAQSADLLTAGSIVPLESASAQGLIWLEEKAVDNAIRPASAADELDAFLVELTGPQADTSGQQVIAAHTGQARVLARTISSALLSLDPERALTLDTRLPRFWKAIPIPAAPIPFASVRQDAVKRIKDILASARFDPVVASLVNDLSIPQMVKDVRYLTGEDPTSDIVSRHSFSRGALEAAAWLKTQFESTGATCELKPFLRGFAPNVVCTFSATEDTTETILLSAHYDSRGSFGSTRAPGGDDDGSGTTSLLGIARTIGRKRVSFRKNVQLVAFAGEEQGLYGSRAYARELHDAGANLTLVVQADMLGYHVSGEPAQLGLPEKIGTPELADLVKVLAGWYSPEVTVGYSSACCSDHQSFYELGFPGTQVFERAGPIADPMYHNSGDLSERQGYDFIQIKSIAKVQFATLLYSAGYEVSA